MKRHPKTLVTLLAIALALAFALAGCAQPATTGETAAPGATSPPVTQPSTYQEAPMLTELVDAGTLPAVEDRLPETPFVLAPRDEIGVYGGTMYSAFPSMYQGQAYQTAGFYEPVLTWNADRTELLPNLVEVYETSEDAKTIRMTIRKGLKWSDGDPVTTEDIEFAYNDVWLNTDLSPTPPTTFTVDGELCQLNVVDEYTFELVFKKAYPSLKYQLCRQGNTDQLFIPSHYLKQFHPNYVDEAELNQLVQDEGFENWMQLYGDKNIFYTNPDRPCLFAWYMESITEDGLIHVMARNPYYFKVDTAGNQLPYLDYQQIEYVENAETLNLKTLAGENEYIYAPPGETLANWTMFAENAEAGNYRLITCGSDFVHPFLIFPNQSSADPVKGPLLANKDFRVALSKAMNREEFVSLFMTVGDFKAEPSQQAPHKTSPYYDEEMATQYTEYDPEGANELLDSLGLEARGADGYRLGPDGNPLQFQLLIPTYNQAWVDGGNLAARYWREVGLNVEAKAVAPEIWAETYQANEHEITIFSTGSGGLLFINADSINSYSMYGINAHTLWGTGYYQYIASDGAEGTEPPEWVLELNRLREEILYEADPDVADQKVEEMLNVWKENLPVLCFSDQLPQFMIISNDLKNTPQNDEPWVVFTFGVGGNVNPCQFYKQP